MMYVTANEKANKEFVIPVTWQVFSELKVQACSLEDAFNWVKEHIEDMPMPLDPDTDYVDGSYEITEESPEKCRPYNVPEFLSICKGDFVIVYDEYSHDYTEHMVKISSSEADSEYVTETNREGRVFYGSDMSSDTEEVSLVHEGNFVRYANESEIPKQIRAVNIKWDVDDLPTVVIVPESVCSDMEKISSWLSEKHGFAHKGFELALLTDYDLYNEREKLKRAVIDAGADAVEEFLGHPLDDESIDIWSEMDNVISRLSDEEYLKYLTVYCGSML